MNDFRAVFDLRKLSDQELGCVEFVLNSPAYMDVFKPYLTGIRDSMNHLWLDRTQKRKDEYPDDFLAGGIASIDGLLNFFDHIIKETSMDRIHESMSHMSNDDIYTRRQEQGRVQPVVGINQPAEPDEYDPAQDI